MNFGTERYYQSSGAVPVGGLLMALLIGCAGSAVVGTAYSFIDWYSPIVYLNFLATCGFAFVTGLAVVFGLNLGKIRNRPVGLLVGLISSCVGLYFSWLVFIWIIGGYPPVTMMVTFLNPVFFFDILQDFAREGLWEIKGSAPTGWGLYTFWLIEAAMVIGGGSILGWLHDSPFCERCGVWTDEHVCDAKLAVPEDFHGLKIDLESEQYNHLLELAGQPFSPDNHVQVKTHSCPNCEESTWMSLEQVVTTTNAKGESNTNTSILVKFLAIPREQADSLKQLEVRAPMGDPKDQLANASWNQTQEEKPEEEV